MKDEITFEEYMDSLPPEKVERIYQLADEKAIEYEMKKPMLYSFVRFKPYIETGEFVNVGLLMCEPDKCKLTYRLVPKNHKRVTDFFYSEKIFDSIRDVIDEELLYIVNYPFDCSLQEMVKFFHRYVDVKEGTVQYSDAAVGIVDDPQDYFRQLYLKFIDNEEKFDVKDDAKGA